MSEHPTPDERSATLTDEHGDEQADATADGDERDDERARPTADGVERGEQAGKQAGATADGDERDDERARPTADGVERGELIEPDVVDVADPDEERGGDEPRNSITEPAKVMRIGSMVKQLLEEVRQAPLDDASRERLAEVYERSIVELSEALSPDLQEELRTLTLPFDHEGVPSDAELRVAKAQLVGWLEGLFHGIQASLVAQQMAARHQLEQMRQLNSGEEPGQRPSHLPPQIDRPGTYI